MGNQDKNKTSLDDVIQAYMASSIDAGRDTLSDWIEEYPEYADGLREFGAYSRLLDNLPSQDYSEDEENTVLARSASIVQGILYKQRVNGAAVGAESVSGLMEEAEKQDISLDQLAWATETSPAIVAMLDDRRVRYESIPGRVIENMARALGKSKREIDIYLRAGIQLAAAHYRSDVAPEAGGLC